MKVRRAKAQPVERSRHSTRQVHRAKCTVHAAARDGGGRHAGGGRGGRRGRGWRRWGSRSGWRQRVGRDGYGWRRAAGERAAHVENRTPTSTSNRSAARSSAMQPSCTRSDSVVPASTRPPLALLRRWTARPTSPTFISTIRSRASFPSRNWVRSSATLTFAAFAHATRDGPPSARTASTALSVAIPADAGACGHASASAPSSHAVESGGASATWVATWVGFAPSAEVGPGLPPPALSAAADPPPLPPPLPPPPLPPPPLPLFLAPLPRRSPSVSASPFSAWIVE